MTFRNLLSILAGIALLASCQPSVKNHDSSAAMVQEWFAKADSFQTISLDSMDYYIRLISKSGYAGAAFYHNKLLSVYYYRLGKNDSALHFAHTSLGLLLRQNDKNELAKLYNRLGSIFNIMECYDSSVFYLRKSLNLYSILNNQQEYGAVLANLGCAYLYSEKYADAILLLDSARQIAIACNDSGRIVSALANIGLAYNEIQDYQKAVMCYDEALGYARTMANNFHVAVILQNLGSAYTDWKKYEMALQFFTESARYYTILADSVNLATTALNIGAVYGNMGLPDSALAKYAQALNIYRIFGYSDGEALALSNIAAGLSDKGRTDEALQLLSQSLAIYKQLKDSLGMTKVYKTMGTIYSGTHQEAMAYEYLHKSLQLAENNHYNLEKIELYNQLSKYLEAMGQYSHSLRYYKAYKTLSDSVFNAESNRQLSYTNVRFETLKRNAAIEQLTAEKQVQQAQLKNQQIYIAGILAGVMILAIFGAILYRQRRLQHESLLVTTQQKLLRSQMNPHFIFNSLGVIQSYALTNDPRKVADFIGHFAQLMRGILEGSINDYINLNSEINLLNNYLLIQQLRLNHCFTFTISSDEHLDPENIEVPPMLIQPFIENSIEHGVRLLKGDGILTLSYSQRGSNLVIRLTDNGPGMAIRTKNPGQHISRAHQITLQRLKLLKKETRKAVTIQITDNHPGVSVELQLPLRKVFF